ncbi:MAG: DinB family protein [Oscillospiraceae bacterium]|nr:DinB family protein [Oscillospiraceae bacterium]
MNSVCQMIRRQTDANFVNLIIALKTYDRDALVKGVPAWRFVYHTLHSADKWFFNPSVYTERPEHEAGSDNPFAPISRIWSDAELLDLLEKVRAKTLDYLDRLDDSQLNEYPPKCEFTRLELILMQFRHMSVHIGMLHGLTVEKTGIFPQYVSPHSMDRLKNGYWDET